MVRKLLGFCALGFLLATFAGFVPRVNSQEIGNYTEKMNIEVLRFSDSIDISYTITQVFQQPSHGIFLVLPQDQGGVWTNYQIQGVQKIANGTFVDEPFDQIKEWNQLRLRVGKPDTMYNPGKYTYKILIRANRDDSHSYQFTLVERWQDPVQSIQVFENGGLLIDWKQQDQICTSSHICQGGARTALLLHKDKPPMPWYHRIINFLWIYPTVLAVELLLFGIIWLLLGRNQWLRKSMIKPEFEPPKGILPWQSRFILDNSIGLKDALLSYLLWLNHTKNITIKPRKNKREDIEVTVTESLIDEKISIPTFQKALPLMEKNGVKQGILDAKLGVAGSEGELHQKIYESLKNYYQRKPIYASWLYALLIIIVLAVITVLSFEYIQKTFLIGNSYIPLIILTFLAGFLGLTFIFDRYGALNAEGLALKKQILGYKYYLEHAEERKLDFSNNPDQTVQYYLKNLAYAASLGVLPSFQKYFQTLVPSNQTIQETDWMTLTANSWAFYTDSGSSSSGDSGSSSSGGFDGGGGSW